MPPKDLRREAPHSSGRHEGFGNLYPVFRVFVRGSRETSSGTEAGDAEGNEHIEIVGDDSSEGTPVPIPNTEVKLAYAEDTWLVTARENR